MDKMLAESSIPHEYYFGDLPGNLQYSKKPEDIVAIENITNDAETCGYVLQETDQRLLPCVLPDTKTARGNWKLILVMKRQLDTQIWYKVAIMNTDTYKVALMTATNGSQNITSKGHRAIKTKDPNWFVGHYRMAAPMVFWRELVQRLG